MVDSSLNPPVRNSLNNLRDVTIASAISSQSLIYNGTEWINTAASGASADTSTTLTIASASGIASDVTVLHDGTAGTLYLVDIPSDVVKSGSNWDKAYASAQVALYGSTSDTSSQVTLASASGINATGVFYHDADPITLFLNEIPQDVIKSGANWQNAYMSAQIANYDGGGISGWYDLDTGTGITAFGGAVAISGTQAETLTVADYIASTNVIENYIPSATAISRFADSASTQTKWYPSSLGKGVSSQVLDLKSFSSNTALVKSGFDSVTDGGTIAHGLGVIPAYASVSPSGNDVNFGASCKIDVTNITVYLTAPGTRDVFWTASI
jgi:hypothetical protein